MLLWRNSMKNQKESNSDRRIFDDTFKTLCKKSKSLLIPLLNEVFSKEYSLETKFELLADEQYYVPDKDTAKGKSKITDSCIKIFDDIYHFECQCRNDGTMIIRMVEYDFLIALDEAMRNGNQSEMVFPKSAVLYLRSGKENHSVLKMRMKMPTGDKIDYIVPIIKMRDYSAERILEKQLFFLLPFYILNYEREILENKDNEKLCSKLREDYIKLCTGLSAAYQKGMIDDFEIHNIIELTGKLVRYVSKNNEAVKSEVTQIMGGRILELESDKIFLSGKDEGIKLGKNEGKNEGKITVFKNMIKRGMDVAEAQSLAELSDEQVAEIMKQFP